MFVVTEADTAVIRDAFDRGGEFAAAVELRRLFPGITDNVRARECARTIAGWRPVPAPLRPVTSCPVREDVPHRVGLRARRRPHPRKIS
jgi:hypothetical protein